MCDKTRLILAKFFWKQLLLKCVFESYSQLLVVAYGLGSNLVARSLVGELIHMRTGNEIISAVLIYTRIHSSNWQTSTWAHVTAWDW